jgi:hypothetical protein
MLNIDQDVLLFYRKHEHDFPARDFNRTTSGFLAWFELLDESLRRSGFTVHQNDFALAQSHPEYPVGLVGTPLALKNWDLPNPAILGPSMYDHPRLNLRLMTDVRFRYYLFTCEWLRDVFAPFYGDKCAIWHAGIDTDKWPDTRHSHKDIDVLIYDKMRWTRDVKERLLLNPVIDHIAKRNLNHYILRYGNISHIQYADLLSRSRCMVFLCEHETQGIAYQEALACNVPILAWDPGYWVDPLWELLADTPVPATSVPQFSPSCGMTFRKAHQFPDCFDDFYTKLDTYEPRRFVQESLSMSESASTYHRYYKACHAS